MASAPTAVTAPASRAPAGGAAVDPRLARATPDLWHFCSFMAQLVLLLAVFYVYDLEERVFGILSVLVVAGFAVHYWVPFRWKEPFYITWSIAGAFLLLTPPTALLLVAVGLALYGVVALPWPFRRRLALAAIITGVMVYARATLGLGIPFEFWPVFGSLFMFRYLIYLYDAAHAKTRPALRDFLTYFFVLPNYYFLLFPVVDFQTHKQTYLRRPINDIVQQGIHWIARGAIQLLLYRLVYHWKGPSNAPEEVTSFGALAATITLTYLLYLRVSGQFHIIIGFLHLFGYDLPETHRRYLLARSLTDFWRRINIYWKDFMVKMVYFPLYFRLRRSGEVRGQVLATAAVFVVTWFLHAYQWFWLRGEFLMTWPDTLFWAILGALVTINILMERGRTRAGADAWRTVMEPLKVAGTFCLIVTLWSLWNAPSLAEWVDLMTWWTLG